MANTNSVEQPAPPAPAPAKPPYFKSPSSVGSSIHSDSRPRGYLPPGGGKR